jgi:regulatory protein
MQKEILKKIEHYCAYQERCHLEVERKLRDLGIYGDDILIYMAHLIAHNFLNEERFTALFVQSKFNQKQWGRVRLKLELQQRHINSRLIDKALKDIAPALYTQTFYQLADKIWETTAETNIWKKKKKTADYLSRKGYEFELIQEFLNDKD